MSKWRVTNGFDALFEEIERMSVPDNVNIPDQDSLPEDTQKSTWEERLKEEEVYDRQQNRIQRKEYADNIFAFLCVYMLFVFLILIGCGSYHAHFGLSDTVLITLITTTTANVIGIFVFVVKYLFNTKP